MGEKQDKLRGKVELTRVVVPPYIRIRDGRRENVKGYTYNRRSLRTRAMPSRPVGVGSGGSAKFPQAAGVSLRDLMGGESQEEIVERRRRKRALEKTQAPRPRAMPQGAQFMKVGDPQNIPAPLRETERLRVTTIKSSLGWMVGVGRDKDDKRVAFLLQPSDVLTLIPTVREFGDTETDIEKWRIIKREAVDMPRSMPSKEAVDLDMMGRPSPLTPEQKANLKAYVDRMRKWSAGPSIPSEEEFPFEPRMGKTPRTALEKYRAENSPEKTSSQQTALWQQILHSEEESPELRDEAVEELMAQGVSWADANRAYEAGYEVPRASPTMVRRELVESYLRNIPSAQDRLAARAYADWVSGTGPRGPREGTAPALREDVRAELERRIELKGRRNIFQANRPRVMPARERSDAMRAAMRARYPGIDENELEMMVMEAEGDRAQTLREETAKAEFKRRVERPRAMPGVVEGGPPGKPFGLRYRDSSTRSGALSDKVRYFETEEDRGDFLDREGISVIAYLDPDEPRAMPALPFDEAVENLMAQGVTREAAERFAAGEGRQEAVENLMAQGVSRRTAARFVRSGWDPEIRPEEVYLQSIKDGARRRYAKAYLAYMDADQEGPAPPLPPGLSEGEARAVRMRLAALFEGKA